MCGLAFWQTRIPSARFRLPLAAWSSCAWVGICRALGFVPKASSGLMHGLGDALGASSLALQRVPCSCPKCSQALCVHPWHWPGEESLPWGWTGSSATETHAVLGVLPVRPGRASRSYPEPHLVFRQLCLLCLLPLFPHKMFNFLLVRSGDTLSMRGGGEQHFHLLFGRVWFGFECLLLLLIPEVGKIPTVPIWAACAGAELPNVHASGSPLLKRALQIRLSLLLAG